MTDYSDLVRRLAGGVVAIDGPIGPVVSYSKTEALMRQAAAAIEALQSRLVVDDAMVERAKAILLQDGNFSERVRAALLAALDKEG